MKYLRVWSSPITELPRVCERFDPADRTGHHPATHLHQGHGAFDRHRHVVIQVGREVDVTSGSGDLCYPIVVVCPAN